VTVRIETFKQEMKDPRPGGRLKQLAVNVKLVSSARRSRTPRWPSRARRGGRRGEVAEKRMARTAPWVKAGHEERGQAAVSKRLRSRRQAAAAHRQKARQEEDLTGSGRGFPVVACFCCVLDAHAADRDRLFGAITALAAG
jgi:hypothetical protein